MGRLAQPTRIAVGRDQFVDETGHLIEGEL
jgi:hypothetical protein